MLTGSVLMNFTCDAPSTNIQSFASGFYTPSGGGNNALYVVSEAGGMRSIGQILLNYGTLVSGNVYNDVGGNALSIKGLHITDQWTVSVLLQGDFSSTL